MHKHTFGADHARAVETLPEMSVDDLGPRWGWRWRCDCGYGHVEDCGVQTGGILTCEKCGKQYVVADYLERKRPLS